LTDFHRTSELGVGVIPLGIKQFFAGHLELTGDIRNAYIFLSMNGRCHWKTYVDERKILNGY
jgi:hypothetical protein